jgi:hypothetical protein
MTLAGLTMAEEAWPKAALLDELPYKTPDVWDEPPTLLPRTMSSDLKSS